jgi:NADPH-dependent ferric siderophore reductase
MTVLQTRPISRSMVRLVLGDGPPEGSVADLATRYQGFTDTYVKLVFGYGDLEHPVMRTYTVRRFDPEAREIWIDVVTHGHGIAATWARQAAPGDEIHVRGPSGAYRPDPAADHHLLVGDEAAIPAVALTLESLTPEQSATVFLEVDGPDDEVPLASDGQVEVQWLHRRDAEAGTTTLLDDAVRAWSWPEGRVQAFVHGEAGLLKTVRPYVLERVPREDVSVSGYWRRGNTEESFRQWKSAQTDAILRPAGR